MNKVVADVLEEISLGEDSKREFKQNIHNTDSLAAEMAAMANNQGGLIFIGVSDDGEMTGLDASEIPRINQLISNAASQHIRSPLAVTTQNVKLPNGKLIIRIEIPEGIDKPYFDKNGIIWLKSGADKRRINSKEELRRIFQISNQFYADELPVRADIDKIDKLIFREFLRKHYERELPEDREGLWKLFKNMNLATSNYQLNLAGLLIFGDNPHLIKPQFIIKAVCFPGNEIHASRFLDSEDFSGTLTQQFAGAMGFITRNLHKIQAGNGVNSLGQMEVPNAVFEELLVNAIIHRDYLISAAIRIFIFDNRIEIISPGCLPNNLTIEKILTGNSIIRNPILVSYIAKGLLPYRGIGSGIIRALKFWHKIIFENDLEGNQFKVTVLRQA
jgi:ATP-dependent DNA helicase RecG